MLENCKEVRKIALGGRGWRTDTKAKPVYTLQFGSKNKLSDLFSATGRGADFKEGAAVCFFSAFLEELTRMDQLA